MKRREFITKFGVLAGGIGTALGGYAATPCQPISLGVVGGSGAPDRACAVRETLQQVAEALMPGEFANMPQEAQNPLTRYNPEISWQTICWHDAARREIQYMGKPQTGVTGNHQHYIFDEALGVWRTTGQALFPSSGHIWSSAFDPATGDYFFKRMAGDSHVKWMRRSVEAGVGASNSPWTQTSGHPELAEAPIQKTGMAWHPNLFGAGDGGLAIFSNDRVMGWQKSTDSWHDIWIFGKNEAYSDTRNGSGIYLPVRNEVILGTGRDANTLLYVTAGSGGGSGSAGVRGRTPIEVSGYNTARSGAILLHPGDDDKILLMENNSGRRVWQSGDGAKTWSLTGWTHPFYNMAGANGSDHVRCTVSPYRVIVGLSSRANSSVTSTFRVWKPPT